MHVTVTGAAGFIGSHTCEALVARGHRVTGVDVFDDYLYPAELKQQNAAELVRALPQDRFELVEADICDPDAMAHVCGAADLDVVCHLAALAGVRPSIAEPLRYTRTNVHGTAVILEAMRRGGRARLVFASSSSVYGARGEAGRLAEVQAFREDDPCLTPASETPCAGGGPSTSPGSTGASFPSWATWSRWATTEAATPSASSTYNNRRSAPVVGSDGSHCEHSEEDLPQEADHRKMESLGHTS